MISQFVITLLKLQHFTKVFFCQVTSETLVDPNRMINTLEPIQKEKKEENILDNLYKIHTL